MSDQEAVTGGRAERRERDGGGAPPLTGFTVGVTAERRADELGALLQRKGAEVRQAPSLRTVPLADDRELRATTRQLVEQPWDVLVANTAVGFRGWLQAAEEWGIGDVLLERMRAAEILARGPKVRGAVRAAGLREAWSPASESLAEVRDRLRRQGAAGRRVAVMLHGEPLPEITEPLRADGADVVEVAVYRRLPPEDFGPVDRMIDAALAPSPAVDAITFTSAPAAAALPARAEQRGLRDAFVDALRGPVLAACVGPVTASALDPYDVPAVHPERFRLGPLVQLLCRELPARAPRLTAAGHRIELRGRAVLLDGEPRPVPPDAMALLRALARRPDEAVGRAELARALPDGADGHDGDEGDAVRAAAVRLRDALGGGGPGGPELVLPLPEEGGYRLAAADPGAPRA